MAGVTAGAGWVGTTGVEDETLGLLDETVADADVLAEEVPFVGGSGTAAALIVTGGGGGQVAGVTDT